MNVRQFGRLLTVVEELVERHFESAGKFLNGLKRRHRVPVFNPGNITPEQTRSLFNLALG